VDKVNELEQAILARADRLAEQYRRQAEAGRGEILREAAEKLRLREEREVLVAKAMAERAYRRAVQSHELKLQARLDQLRWNLVTGLLERLEEQLQQVMQDQPRYQQVLRDFLVAGAQQFGAEDLVVEVNAADHQRLEAQWEQFAGTIPDKRIRLAEQPIECLGGLRLRTPDNRVRLDHTFDGRIHRLRTRLYQAIQERLLPPSAEDISATMAAG
jgi:V/A-type H+-transporting ATPase subunit E